MARYRKSWENKETRWNYRLDIVPYDADLSHAITNINSATVAIPKDGFDVTERGFDDVPIGLCLDTTMKINFIYDALPSALQTYLNTKEVGGERNLFLLFSDRGTAGVTYTLEGAFVQAGIGGKKYKYEGAQTQIEVELMDAAYWVMTDTTAEAVYGAYAMQDSTALFRKLYEVGFPTVSRSDAYDDASTRATDGWSDRFYTGTWAYVMERASDIVCNEYVNKAARTANALGVAQFEAFDVLDNWQTGLFNCITLKAAADNAVRTATGAALDKDTLHVVTHVYSNSNNHIGGMFASEDERGWARYESVRDLLQDLAESVNGKLYYNHEYVTDAVNGDYLSLNWYWVPIAGDRTTDTAAMTVDLGKALEAPETDEMEVKIGKAEVRFDTNSSDDVKETVANEGVSRGSRSYNTRCIMTNAPVVKPNTSSDANTDAGDTAGFGSTYKDAISKGLFQTNLFCYVSGTTCFKVHEYTRVFDSFNTYTDYDHADFRTVPSGTDSTVQLAQYNLWVKQAQTVGTLGYALAYSLTRVLGNNNLASITVTFRHSDYVILGDSLGRVHNITGTLATATPHLGWDRAVITNIKIDWTKGTTEVTYLLVKI